MKAQYRTAAKNLLIEVEASTTKGLFKALAEAQEIFDAETQCGRCHGENIHFRVREIDEFEFYELHCRDCGGVLSFSQLKNHTGLFAKRMDENRKPLPNGGWRIYDPNGNAPQPAASKPAAVKPPTQPAAAKPAAQAK